MRYLTHHSSVSHPPVVSPDGREQEGHLPLHDRHAGSLSHAVTEVRGQNQSPALNYVHIICVCKCTCMGGKVNGSSYAITRSVRME